VADFFNPATTPAAKKAHQCIGCFHPIAKGEVYHRQTGNYDGRWFVNKLHVECADELSGSNHGGWYEFSPGELEPPERLRAQSTPQPADVRADQPLT
jgi:hypothetical protein